MSAPGPGDDGRGWQEQQVAAEAAEAARLHPVSSTTGGIVMLLLIVNLVVVILVDGYWISRGQTQNTVSSSLRVMNARMGGLLALAWLVLFVHLFIPLKGFFSMWSNADVATVYNAGTG